MLGLGHLRPARQQHHHLLQRPRRRPGTPRRHHPTALTGGYRHTCAVVSDGSARCWGRNTEGQLGNSTNTASRVAVTPTGLTTGITAIVAGGAHTCAVQTGTVKCFGLNSAGQLGNGTIINSSSPASVPGLAGVTGVAGGGSHSCAFGAIGTVSCWGLNQEGELGIGDPVVNNVVAPVLVLGLTGQSEVSAGIQHVCSRTSTVIKCWGLNTGGQLGNGTTTRSFSPVTVQGF